MPLLSRGGQLAAGLPVLNLRTAARRPERLRVVWQPLRFEPYDACAAGSGARPRAEPRGRSPAAWAVYTRPDQTFLDHSWKDVSGNGRDGVAYAANTPIAADGALRVNAADKVVFPAGSIPVNFTIFARARYADATTRGRITTVDIGAHQVNNQFYAQGTYVPSGLGVPGTLPLPYERFAGRNSPSGPTFFHNNVPWKTQVRRAV